MADYVIPADGHGLAALSSLVVMGVFEEPIGQRPGNAVGMGVDAPVDVWQVRVTTTYMGDAGAVVHVMRWSDTVNAGQYHVTPGTKAVLFLSGLPNSGLYTTVSGDAGLLLLDRDGRHLTSPGATVPGLETVDDVAALF